MFTIKYKNIDLIALGALLSFSSCEKEADSDNENGVVRLESFYAVMDGDTQDDLKSYQQGCYGIHEMHNKWNANDEARLICVDAHVRTAPEFKDRGIYRYDGVSSGKANFRAYMKLDIEGAEPYAMAAHNCDWNESNQFDYGIYTNYEIKESQTYSDSIVGLMPMMAIHGPFWENSQKNLERPQNITFKFENLASVIRFDVTPDHNDHTKSISQITVKGKNICGKGKAYYNEDLKLVTEWTGGGNQITLFCGNGTERNGVLSYVMIVPELTNVPLEITIKASNGKTKTLKGNATIQRSEFKKVAIDLADF